MKRFSLLAAMVSLLTMPACFLDDDFPHCVNGKGDRTTEVLDIPDFSGIELNIHADVYIEQGAQQRVEIKAQENIIDLLKRDVKGGIWEIEFDRCAYDFSDVEITITMPGVDLLRLSSSGNIIGGGFFDANLLDLIITGSGDIELDVDATGIDATVSGSGDMRISGQTQTLDILISGSGDFEGFELEAENADLTISGSGDIECFVNGSMDVTISGSGDVFYKGNPAIDVGISGSGKLVNAN
ncbi:MAG: DUF2807 domain-containing protein [Saprospirales bacterium]|nr:DUF2807 domain-containing protein [Saprospirales bacterium]MBK7335634.1 DUF2807 domain-containing protein [Saprospirales bacterium]